MKRYAVGIGALVLAIVVVLWMVQARTARAPGPQACSQEAKICLDGSAVGRTGPNCEFAACPTTTATSTTGGGGSGILPYNSGVRGAVSLGPTCPVMRDPPDPQCADKPYATAIVVYRTGSNTPYIIGNSDATGTFTFSLPAGSYTLNAGGDKVLPRCAPVNVTVTRSEYAATTISCDTGIR